MELILKIERQDINTSLIGSNIFIKTKNGLQVIFTQEALKELFVDYENLKDEIESDFPSLPFSEPTESTFNFLEFFRKRKCDNPKCSLKQTKP
ncbi:hypothetical protein LNJ03_11245 [Tenacibaculum dicentrarchi]|nr:hypothetical protein [Tenacibaculum dicentrarchi]